jgi:hypothetical protein
VIEAFGALALSFLGSLLAQTQLVSHITKRLVDDFFDSRQPPETTLVTAVVIRDQDWDGPDAASVDLLEELLVCPVPPKFMLVGDADGYWDRIALGVLLDGETPRISWTQVALLTPIEFSSPPNALAFIVAEVPGDAGGSLELLGLSSQGVVDGFEIVLVYREPGAR